MADLESVISGAIEASGQTDGDASEFVSESEPATDDTGSEGVETAVETSQDDAGAVAGSEDGGQEGVEKTTTQEAVEDAFAKEHGLQPQKPGQKENRIPYSRVKAITSNAERKIAEAALGTALVADKPLAEQVKAHVAQIPELQTRVKQFESKIAEYDAIGDIMDKSPEQFLALLPHVNPRYAELLKGGAASTPNQPTQSQEDWRLPDPDVEIPGFGKTYSVESLQKAILSAVDAAVNKSKQAVDGELKPIREAREARQRIDAAASKTIQRVRHAEENWPDFKENGDAILKVLQEDRAGKLSLEDAYAMVLKQKREEERAKLSTDRNKVRAELMEELKKAPKSTGTAPGTSRAAAPSSTGKKSLETIMKERIDASRA